MNCTAEQIYPMKGSKFLENSDGIVECYAPQGIHGVLYMKAGENQCKTTIDISVNDFLAKREINISKFPNCAITYQSKKGILTIKHLIIDDMRVTNGEAELGDIRSIFDKYPLISDNTIEQLVETYNEVKK